MNIAGIGIISTRGRGLPCFEETLKLGWMPPSNKEVSSMSKGILPVYSVEQKTIEDREVFKKVRRLDRFCKMAVLAAYDALSDSGISIEEDKAGIGIIVATGFGPHATTFRFLEDILDHGDRFASPTLFSHSVHNAAASYISSIINSHGPTITMSQFIFSLHQALILAEAWIREKRCKYVLVGSIDECGDTMEYIFSRKISIADDGKIKPFQFSEKSISVPGEGSVFFLVTDEDTPKKYCKVSNVRVNGKDVQVTKPDVYIFDTDGIIGDETVYKNIADPSAKITGYSPLFGSIMSGTGFSCAAGAVMLKNQMYYACPVQDNPHSVNICASTEKADIKEIQCIRFDCVQEKAVIKLTL